jgi:hypothetical protein
MMRAISRHMIRSLCVLGLAYLGLQLGHPHSAIADMGCSNATLKGTYIYAESGWQIDADNVRKPFAFSGMETYNGDGTMRGILSGSIDGVVIQMVGYTGTSTIHQNCTGEQTFTDDTGVVTHYDVFVAPSGDEFTFVQTDPGFVSAGSEHRVKSRVVKPERA